MSELVVREATAADNEAIIALELHTPLVIGDIAETFDRSPDVFACCRLHAECRIVVAALDGRIVGLMAGVVIRPQVQGRERRLVYIHRARVDPDARHKRVAWSLSNHLFAWGGERGAEGPCYMIAPENAPSLAFVARGGGRWPVDVVTLHLQASGATAAGARPLSEDDLPRAVALINATHAGSDFFEPLTAGHMHARLNRDPQYSIVNLRGVFDGTSLVAVAGMIDRGAHTERIDVNRRTGEVIRSRRAAVADWGFAPGCERPFEQLLEHLAAEARALGRSAVSICEPFPGAVPATLPFVRSAIALFTPAMPPPAAADMRGLYFDPLNL